MMKNSKLALILATLAVFGVIAWTPPSDDDLIVGPTSGSEGNTGNSSTGYLGIIGTKNKVRALNSLVVGDSNEVTAGSSDPFTQQSLVVGRLNVLTGAKNRNLVTGNANSVSAGNSFVAGTNNLVYPPLGATYSIFEAAAIGKDNEVHAERGWTMGANNGVTGNYGVALGASNTVSGAYGSALGSGLSVTQENSVAFGAWNAPMVSGDLLVVGNGSSTVSSTAFRVTKAGDVLVTKAQGDISMGPYSN